MKKIFILLTIIIVAITGFYIWWNNGEIPVDSNDTSQKIFIVNAHENIRDVGYELKKQNLIRDPIVFFLLIKQQGLDGKIQAGDFQLSPSQSASEIAQSLTHGEKLGIKITIPEGKRATEIADILQKKIPTYALFWKDRLATEEGYLFPDTYLIPKDADIDLIVNLMKNNFEKKYQQAVTHATTKLTKDQVITLASIVQREGKTPEDMKLVASVLQNRLNANIALDVDASIQYALGYQPVEHNWWKKNLSIDDLKINSLYNTYINPGLPPTPICNPGLSAIEATLNPTDSSYIYYISDNTGKLHFEKTLEEHNADVRKYIQ